MYNLIDSDIYISFESTLQCNMSCVYCYNKHRLIDKPDDNKFITLMFLRKLEQKLIQFSHKIFEIDILGGEPSISNNSVILINKLLILKNKYSNLKLISLTTNNKEILYNINDLISKDITIEATFHNGIDVDIFKKNLLYYKQNEFNIICTINLFPVNYNMNELKEILIFCNMYNIKSVLIEIYVNDNYVKTHDYAELYKLTNMKNYTYKNGMTNINIINNNYFKANTNSNCRLLSLNILFDGTISTSCGHKLKIKNIKTDDLPIFKIVKCNGILCEGISGVKQKISFEKEKNDRKNNT